MGDRKIHWRCFHCDAAFTKAQERWAREHFGRDCSAEPVCLIRTAGEDALLTALRSVEDELAGYRAEDQNILRAMWSMQADHRKALIREEERGYEKGLRDGRSVMPLFNCTSCGAIENTALSNYWTDQHRGDKSVPFNPLCSKCDPRIGQWHGRFERTYEPVPERSLAPGAPKLLNAARSPAEGGR